MRERLVSRRAGANADSRWFQAEMRDLQPSTRSCVLREPQHRIVQSMTSLLALVPTEEEVVAAARSVME